jgi:hypothetical protein
METDADVTRTRFGHRLFYRGPSSDVLHEDYAKGGRIDSAAPVTACHEVFVDAPIDRVWDVLSDADGWATVNPDIRHVRLDSAVAPDSRFRWVNGRTRLKSRFAVVDAGHELTWTRPGVKVVIATRSRRPATVEPRLFRRESLAGPHPAVALVFSGGKLQSYRWPRG